MKIKNLKINGFGKIKDKEISLTEGINVIYGENEAGKSSMLKFISSNAAFCSASFFDLPIPLP